MFYNVWASYLTELGLWRLMFLFSLVVQTHKQFKRLKTHRWSIFAVGQVGRKQMLTGWNISGWWDFELNRKRAAAYYTPCYLPRPSSSLFSPSRLPMVTCPAQCLPSKSKSIVFILSQNIDKKTSWFLFLLGWQYSD